MSEHSSSGEVILAFVLGAIAGAAAGLLFAPASGRETRKKLKDMSEDLEEQAGEFIVEAKEKVAHFAHDARQKAEHIAHEAKDKVNEVKEKMLDQKERLESAFEAGKKAYEKK